MYILKPQKTENQNHEITSFINNKKNLFQLLDKVVVLDR